MGIIGFDRGDAILNAFAAQGHPVTREDFPVRCDDQLVYWKMMVAGAGLGFAQTLLARRHPDLEQVDIGLPLPVLPVWLVMHEELRTNAHIRRAADFLGSALTDVLRKA